MCGTQIAAGADGDRAIRQMDSSKGNTIEMSLVDSALRGWKSNVERADKLFGALFATT